MGAQAKKQEINIVLTELKAKICEDREGNLVASYGLGDRKERGDRSLEWCQV